MAMRLGQLAFANLLVLLGLVVGIATAAGADCNIPFVPPARTPFYCTSSTPEQLQECRQEANQNYEEQVASSRQEWQRRQLECQAKEQQRDAKQGAEERAGAEKLKQARQAEEIEQVRLKTAKMRAEELALPSNQQLATRDGTERDRSAAGSSNTVITILFATFLALLIQWIRTKIPVSGKLIAILVAGGMQLVVYFLFGINLHDPVVINLLKFSFVPGVSLTLGLLIHHASA